MKPVPQKKNGSRPSGIPPQRFHRSRHGLRCCSQAPRSAWCVSLCVWCVVKFLSKWIQKNLPVRLGQIYYLFGKGLGCGEKTAAKVAQSCILLFFLLAWRPEMICRCKSANSSTISEGYPSSMNLLVWVSGYRIKMSVLMRQFGKVLSYLAAQGHRNQGFEKTGYLKPHGVSVSTLKLQFGNILQSILKNTPNRTIRLHIRTSCLHLHRPAPLSTRI